MSTEHNYANEIEAARGLLCEAVDILNSSGIAYAVVGGWIPFLFNNHPLKHPGTFDVDVLLNDRMKLDEVVKALDRFVSGNYRMAVKNKFQIFRELTVGGKPLIFHVDFLHRKYAETATGQTMHWGPYQSISGPGSDLVFLENENTTEGVAGILPNGDRRTINVTFCSEPGFLSTKGRSISFGKRTRDAYDVFLLVYQSRDRVKLVARCTDLKRHAIFKYSMARLWDEFNSTTQRALRDAVDHLLDNNHGVSRDEALALVGDVMGKFFRDIDVHSASYVPRAAP